MSKKKKNRTQAKRKQRKAVKEATRRHLQRQANAQVRRYMKGRRRPVDLAAEYAKTQEKDPRMLTLDQEVTFAHCQGVGECCKNRPIYVEPTDIWRIMHNDRAREKFGLEVTMDLYPKADEGDPEKMIPGPLVYQVDKKTHLPFCAVHRVELSKILPPDGIKPGVDVNDGDQACPFFGFLDDGTPECILGDDRLTQCASDPICRTGKLDHLRRLSAWEYALMDQQCLGCVQASEDQERTMKVRDWLVQKDMEDRLAESDLYHGFIGWHRDQMKAFDGKGDHEFFWKMATNIMFDWDRFAIEYLEQPKEEVLEHGPSAPKEVYLAARTMMEGIINGYKPSQGVEDGAEQVDVATGESDQE
jgi:hypothetical protein